MNPVADFAAFFKNGGPFMVVILITGLLVFALSLERFWVIQRAAQLNSAKLGKDLLRMVRRGDKGGAVALCQKVEAPVTRRSQIRSAPKACLSVPSTLLSAVAKSRDSSSGVSCAAASSRRLAAQAE
jgi:hypothetical protein